jgi:hypothetical protein
MAGNKRSKTNLDIIQNPESLSMAIVGLIATLVRYAPSERLRIMSLLHALISSFKHSFGVDRIPEASVQDIDFILERLFEAREPQFDVDDDPSIRGFHARVADILGTVMRDNTDPDFSDVEQVIVPSFFALQGAGPSGLLFEALVRGEVTTPLSDAVYAHEMLLNRAGHECSCVSTFVDLIRNLPGVTALSLLDEQQEDFDFSVVVSPKIAFTIGRSHVGLGPDLIIEIPEHPVAFQDARKQMAASFLACIEGEIVAGGATQDDSDHPVLRHHQSFFHLKPVALDLATQRIRDALGSPDLQLPSSADFATLTLCIPSSLGGLTSFFRPMGSSCERPFTDLPCDENRH